MDAIADAIVSAKMLWRMNACQQSALRRVREKTMKQNLLRTYEGVTVLLTIGQIFDVRYLPHLEAPSYLRQRAVLQSIRDTASSCNQPGEHEMFQEQSTRHNPLELLRLCT